MRAMVKMDTTVTGILTPPGLEDMVPHILLILGGGALLGGATTAVLRWFRGPSRMLGPRQEGPVQLRVGAELEALLKDARVLSHVDGFRQSLTADLGVPIPPVEIQPDPTVPPLGYRLVHGKQTWSEATVDPQRVLVLHPVEHIRGKGIPAEPCTHPLTGESIAWVAVVDKERCVAANLSVRPAVHAVALEVDAQLKRRVPELLGLTETQQLLAALDAPTLVHDAVEDGMGAARLTGVLRGLLAEDVPVLHLKRILEVVAANPDHFDDVPIMVEHVRRGVRDHIMQRILGNERVLPVVRLSEPLLTRARAALRQDGDGATLQLEEPVVAVMHDTMEKILRSPESRNAVVLVPPELRAAVRKLFAPRFPGLRVLSLEEIPKEIRIKTVSGVDVP